MQIDHQISTPNSSANTPIENISQTNNYAEILDSHGVEYRSMEYYWHIGQMKNYRCWVLHLSVITPQIPELLQIILPVLLHENVPFKIIRNRILASQLLEGQLGFTYLGKIIVIYPRDNQHALELAKKLLPLTKAFKGPCIPTDRWLGEIIYTQFETSGSNVFDLQAIRNKQVMCNSDTIQWPFEELISHDIPKRPILLNFRYYPIASLKKDAKGDVVKALFFKKLWNIRTCVIKQGRKYMLFDDYNRDIQDRLKWQYKLFEQLSDSVPLPKAIDFFEESGDVYFVMEFIHGSPVSAILNGLYMGAAWYDLPQRNQIKVTTYLLEIIEIIHRLHEKGFVHRDITLDNFLIDKNQKIWMLDIELMYSIYLHQPYPPFQLGTPGSMSPEQLRSETPTIKEDIYAIGAFMLALFTNLPPTKFLEASKDALRKSIFFFIQNNMICNLISDCLVEDPLDRPDLKTIRASIVSFCDQLQQNSYSSFHPKTQERSVNKKELRMAIQAALNGLVHSVMLSPDQLWLSNFQTIEHKIGNEQIGMIVYSGWHIGLAGPLWLLAIAKTNDFEIENCSVAYMQSWGYISKSYFRAAKTEKSLFSGGAGISLALSAAFHSRLLPENDPDLQLEKCFSQTSSGFSLEGGIAGQGLALLQARYWMNISTGDELLSSFINSLLNTQRRDGTWNMEWTEKSKENYSLTLDRGLPGIIWFLLHYLDNHLNNDVLTAMTKALNWLIKTSRNKFTNIYSMCRGTPGITLVLLKAYQATGDSRYRTIVESNLKIAPERPVLTDFSLGNGLAGLGELYLEAYKVLKDPIWLERATWITQVLLHTFQLRSPEGGYWITERTTNITADLFSGNSGIIHFLMRYLLPDKVQHPLAIITK